MPVIFHVPMTEGRCCSIFVDSVDHMKQDQKQDCRSEAKEMAHVFKLYFMVLYSLVWKAVNIADELLKR